MSRRFKWIAGGVLALAVVASGTGYAVANSSEDQQGNETPLTGSNLEQASAAALEHVGSGTVVETEVSDDGAAYSVEVRLENGAVVEVALDETLRVVGQESDDDGSQGTDDAGG
jgi:uncharacterized membrane protein YkoI